MNLSIINWHNITALFKAGEEVCANMPYWYMHAMCSGGNTVLITMINWIMLRAIMGELKRVCN